MDSKILVIDDEVPVLEAIEIILEGMGHEVECFSDPFEGERKALQEEYDLILVDIHMPVTLTTARGI